MNANRQFDEDDLVLYAMRLLAEPERADVAAFLAASPAAQRRLAEIYSTLAAYAEASVQPQSLPSGSLDRLLSRVEREPRAAAPIPAIQATSAGVSTASAELTPAAAGATGAVQAANPGPAPIPAVSSRPARGPVTTPFPAARPSNFGWAAALGWATAALFAVGVGVTLQQRASLRHAVDTRETQIASLSTDVESLRRERDTLRNDLSSQQQRLESSSTALTATQNQAAALKNEADNARNTATALSGQTSQLSARLSAEQARATAAEQERSRLQGTLAAQADQLAALQGSTSNAEVMATLTDPSALRVVLTRPKSKPAPVGRAAYVASKGSLVFLASNLQPLKANKVYELWILPADGANPVPAGTFTPDAKGDAHVVYARFPRAVPAKGLAMTIENAGGATTPTLPLILAGS